MDDDRLHLTLHFIGALPASRLDELLPALAVEVTPCDLVLDRIECWPRGLVVWRASVLPPPLQRLHRGLARALQALQLPVERRPLRPHVTLARRALLRELPAVDPLPWPLRGHVLVHSRPDGRYEVLQRWDWPSRGSAPPAPA